MGGTFTGTPASAASGWTFGGWGGGTNLNTLLERAKIYAGISSYAHLGSTTDYQNTRVAEYVNEAVLEYLRRNPVLGRAETNLSVVSGTQSYDIPTALLGCQIEKLYYTDSGSDAANDLRVIPYASAAQVQAFPLEWANGEETAEHPFFWSLDITGAHVVFYPMPDTTQTVVCQYRQEPTAITYSNVASPTSVTINEVPGEAQGSLKALALLVAAGLCEIINPDKEAELLGRFEAEIGKVQEELARVLAAQRPDAVQAQDYGPISGGFQFPGMFRGL